MVSVRLLVDPTTGRYSYEVEGQDDELLGLSDEKLKQLSKKLASAAEKLLPSHAPISEVPRREEPRSAKPDIVSSWIENVQGRPHLASAVRNLTLKDQILVGLYALRTVTNRETITSKSLWEFMRDDGFPVSYSSLLARVSELTREAKLIRMGSEGIRLSRAADQRVLEIMQGGDA